jgi:hypothetical protein
LYICVGDREGEVVTVGKHIIQRQHVGLTAEYNTPKSLFQIMPFFPSSDKSVRMDSTFQLYSTYAKAYLDIRFVQTSVVADINLFIDSNFMYCLLGLFFFFFCRFETNEDDQQEIVLWLTSRPFDESILKLVDSLLFFISFPLDS